MKKFFKFLYKKIVAGGVMGIAFVLCAGAVLAFTEPSSGPSVTEPASADSTGQIETLFGTPQSTSTATSTIFGYLRNVYTDIGGTPSSVAPNASDAGKLVDLIGTTATAVDGKTLFNFLKNINDSLDFPETSSVLSSDTVKNVSGSVSNCSTPGAQSCYATGSYYASTACASQGSQSCYATGSYYAATTQTLSAASETVSQGYYAATTLSTVDSDLAASKIKSGTIIFGVTGTFGNGPCCGSSTPSPGTVCSDGTVYAGLSPDGNEKMCVTPADSGSFSWNDGVEDYVVTGYTSTTDGDGNTGGIASKLDSESPHHAVQYCGSLLAYGYNDWYLPAKDELNVIYTNNVAIGGFDKSNSVQYYWSSSELGTFAVWHQRFTDGNQTATYYYKASYLHVRCARKGS